MPATGVTTFSDSGKFQTGFRGATISLVFTSPGIFSARLTSVSLPHLRLYSVQESLPRIAYISLPQEFANFTFSTLSGPAPSWGNAEMKSCFLIFHGAGERIHQRTYGASKWHILSIDFDFLAASSKALTGLELTPPRLARIFDPRGSTQLGCGASFQKHATLPKPILNSSHNAKSAELSNTT